MDGEFPALCISGCFYCTNVNTSGLPIALRLNTATFSSEKDAHSISIRVAVVERLIERKLFVLQNVASILMKS